MIEAITGWRVDSAEWAAGAECSSNPFVQLHMRAGMEHLRDGGLLCGSCCRSEALLQR